MVCMCPVTKRIWVGAKNGGLAFYDLKQHSKCQVCADVSFLNKTSFLRYHTADRWHIVDQNENPA